MELDELYKCLEGISSLKDKNICRGLIDRREFDELTLFLSSLIESYVKKIKEGSTDARNSIYKIIHFRTLVLNYSEKSEYEKEF